MSDNWAFFRVLISAICLSFFPPSSKFQLLLERYISVQTNGEMNTSEVPVSIYAKVCQKRLEKILQTGPKKGLKKPTLEEIELSKVQFKGCNPSKHHLILISHSSPRSTDLNN